MSTDALTFRRDLKVASLIGVAHFVSHFFQLALPPLFPFLTAEFDVGYTELGLMMTLFYALSGILQFPSGVLIDRIGAKAVLFSGIFLLASGLLIASAADSFLILVIGAAVTGIGNAVFHPADFAVMNASISEKRLGRAYGMHGLTGHLGWAAAPVVSFGLATAYDWRTALVIMAIGGIAVLALVAAQAGVFQDHRIGESRKRSSQAASGQPAASTWSMLTSPAVLLCFVFFLMQSGALVGMQSFTVPTLPKLHEIDAGLAAIALSTFSLSGAAGTVLGGFLVDRLGRIQLIAIVGYLSAALCVALLVVVGNGPLILLLIGLSGLGIGLTTTSRDLTVRQATPAGATGKVYGFVYSGLDLGSAITPAIFGILLDRGEPQVVFLLVSAILVVAIFTLLQVKPRKPSPAAAPAE